MGNAKMNTLKVKKTNCACMISRSTQSPCHRTEVSSPRSANRVHRRSKHCESRIIQTRSLTIRPSRSGRECRVLRRRFVFIYPVGSSKLRAIVTYAGKCAYGRHSRQPLDKAVGNVISAQCNAICTRLAGFKFYRNDVFHVRVRPPCSARCTGLSHYRIHTRLVCIFCFRAETRLQQTIPDVRSRPCDDNALDRCSGRSFLWPSSAL